MSSVTFNGKTYNDLAEMPAAERQNYDQLMAHFKDENQDGTPDIFQGDVVSNIVNAIASTNFIVNGKQISGFGDLTQEQRIKLEKGMGMLKKMGILSEIPNLDGGIHPPHSEAMPVWDDAEIHASRPLIQQTSAIQEDKGNSPLLIIAFALFSVLLCGVGLMAYFLLGQ